MKILGVTLLVLGVILSASAGIRLGKTEYQATAADGRVLLSEVIRSADVTPVDAATRLDDWFDEAGKLFVAGIVLLVIGAVIGRIATDRDGAVGTGVDGQDFDSQLRLLAGAIEETRQRMDEETLEETRDRIERSLEDHVLPMIEARAVLRRRFGQGGSALMLGPLSGAERMLNRAWSVLVDGHAPEGKASLAAAAAEVEVAQQALVELQSE
jgi:hypothetical protein